MNGPRLLILCCNSGVTDMGIGESDDLSSVGGISQDFLVTRHGGVEDDLTHRVTVSTNGRAAKNRAIFQSEDSGF